MEKKIAGVLGAVAALGALGTAQAATVPNPADVLTANSYADLLEPIPNAPQVLQALDSQPTKTTEANVQVAQLYIRHHHHHGYWHHHHHHYRGPVVVVPRRGRYYHHHHHHHHHGFGVYVR